MSFGSETKWVDWRKLLGPVWIFIVRVQELPSWKQRTACFWHQPADYSILPSQPPAMLRVNFYPLEHQVSRIVLCVFVCVCVKVYMHMCAFVGQRIILGVILRYRIPLFQDKATHWPGAPQQAILPQEFSCLPRWGYENGRGPHRFSDWQGKNFTNWVITCSFKAARTKTDIHMY